jgi:lysophospholipase L1-like esterase
MSVLQRWKSKKMNALGDSLTHGDITGTGGDGTPWTSYMNELTGLAICRNYGINGNKITGEGGMADRYADMDNDADVVCVFGGMNDFCRDVPLGKIEETGISTFYGALNTLAKGLYAKFPDAEMFFITPPKCKSSLYGWESFTRNNAGLILKDYRDAILSVADKYSMPLLDLYSVSGMSCYLDNGKFRPDGLHFTNAGYERIAVKITSFLTVL